MMFYHFIAALFLFTTYVSAQGCSWHGYFPDVTGLLSDIAIPRIFTAVEVFYYTNCTQVFTALGTAIVSGHGFSAQPMTITFANPATAILLTYTYTGLTLTSLTELQPLTVIDSLLCTDPTVAGGGTHTVIVPFQSYTRPTSTVTVTAWPSTSPTSPGVTITAFVTTTMETTSGVSAATTGGIAGGIASGFLLFGAGVFFFMIRGNRNRDATEYGKGGGDREMVPVMRDPKPRAQTMESPIACGRTEVPI